MTSTLSLLCWLLLGLLTAIDGFSLSGLKLVRRSALVMQEATSPIAQEGVTRRLQRLALSGLLALGLGLPAYSSSALADQQTLSRADVGFLDLQKEEPRVTDICWMDLQVGPSAPPQRIEISLYGKLGV